MGEDIPRLSLSLVKILGEFNDADGVFTDIVKIVGRLERKHVAHCPYRFFALRGHYHHRLCAEGFHQKSCENGRGDYAVRLRLVPREEHEAGQNEYLLALLYVFDKSLSSVNGERLAREAPCPVIEDAANAVAPGVKIHQCVEVVTDIKER